MNKTFVAIAASALLLSGCVISVDDDNDYENHNSRMSWSQIEENNRESISALSIGNSLNSVRRKMGVPDFDELMIKGDKEHRVLYYRTQRNRGDGATTKDECTPIVFINGELVGFGESALGGL